MARGDHAVWNDVLAYLRQHHVQLCRQWFDEVEPLGVRDGQLLLRVAQPVRRGYLERECADQFAEAAQAVTQRLVSVRFLGPDDDVEVRPRPQPSAVAGGAEGAARVNGSFASSRGLTLNPDNTFENFVTGPGNQLAHAAAVAVAEKPGRAYNPVFVHGGVGLGKTHLLQAICLKILDAAPETNIHYISCDEFINRFYESVQVGEMSEFRHAFRDTDMLVIDDIHFLAKRERVQEEFFHTFNSLHQAGKQIVVSSDGPPEQIPQLEDRLISRFKWGLVAEMEPPGYDTRVAIVRQKAKMRGLTIDDETASFVAARVESNIRELEGAIVRLQMQAAVERRPIDAALAVAALGDAPNKPKPQLGITTIMDAVADFYSVKLSDLQSKRRPKSIAQPRQVCMYLARKHTRHSLEEIGGYFGGRDHTTVMHAVNKVQERLEMEDGFTVELQTIERRLGERVAPQKA